MTLSVFMGFKTVFTMVFWALKRRVLDRGLSYEPFLVVVLWRWASGASKRATLSGIRRFDAQNTIVSTVFKPIKVTPLSQFCAPHQPNLNFVIFP